MSKIYDMNEFLGTVVQKIGRQEYSSKSYKNPLAVFKNGFITNANEIEEIYVARVQMLVQDYTGVDTLKRVLPIVDTAYHKQNYAGVYTVSVSDAQVRRAFTTDGGVKKIADEMLNQMQTGYEYDEFVAMKENISDAVNFTNAKRVPIEAITDQQTAMEFAKEIKKASKKMTFRNTLFCKYETNTEFSDQVLILDSDIVADSDIELMLFTIFGKDKLKLPTTVVEIDGFSNPEVKGMLVDKGIMKCFDTLYNVEPQRNAKGMFTNHHLNTEKIISLSDMYNACIFHTGILPEPTGVIMNGGEIRKEITQPLNTNARYKY